MGLAFPSTGLNPAPIMPSATYGAMSRNSWRDRILEPSPPSRSMATFSSTQRIWAGSSTSSKPPFVFTSRSTPSSSDSPRQMARDPIRKARAGRNSLAHFGPLWL